MARKKSQKLQDELIQEEIEKINSNFAELPEDKRKIAQRLIERIAFMTITLQILEDTIKAKGPTYNFTQGSQKMLVENPAQKSYNAMINRYTAAYDKLFSLLPKDDPDPKDSDGFDSFVAKR
ncbi:hypothetical protein [Halobacillus aidingensis]|uniref:Phage terminase, small subunit n=1 Tax=Halobacillus aidingensis TaxID=240303 RepID=A0A1H0MH05_HALAD|nr:hypothetical protein [Halobacillus aidingensis]SDO79605.1 hypothetical protein SAMN05421677_10833 [Halobacillus aidingensis]